MVIWFCKELQSNHEYLNFIKYFANKKYELNNITGSKYKTGCDLYHTH